MCWGCVTSPFRVSLLLPRGTSPAPGRAQQQAVRIGFCATDGLLPEVQNQAFFIAACDLDAAGNILP